MSLSVVSLNSIAESDRYMVGRANLLRDLEQSVKKCGLLEPPLLLETAEGYEIISGHNRVRVLRNLGIGEVSAEIRESFDVGEYLRTVQKKMYHKSVSLSGRITAYSIISRDRSCPMSDSDLKSSLQIPAEIDMTFAEKFLSAGKTMYSYCNEKDAPFRVIELALSADDRFGSVIRNLMTSNISISSLRGILELYDDIRRDGNMYDALSSFLENSGGDTGEAELSAAMKRIRYPEIESAAMAVGRLSGQFRKMGAELRFPVYEEGQPVTVSIVLKKRNCGESYIRTLEKLREFGVEEIEKIM
jgi:hypothetical protein